MSQNDARLGLPRDLREYTARLETAGELLQVAAEVDCDLEIGAIARRAADQKKPALLFEKIRDFPGHRLLINQFGPTRPRIQGRVALALGLPKDLPATELIEYFARRSQDLVPPVLVEQAPCQENVLLEDEVDLLRFPSPLLHGVDGGRYLGTWSMDVTRDPQSGHVNWGTYRHMVHDARHLGWFATPNQHGPSVFYQHYEPFGQPMPMAIVIGMDPVSSIAAASQLPSQISEVEAAGGLRGEPVELVRCKTIDLEVPARAEIVLEGEVLPGERWLEGPFGEFPGYDAGARLPRPVFRVKCITHRHNPILTAANIGKPWDESHVVISITMSALLLNDLRQRGVPVRAVYCPPPYLGVIVSVKPQYAGYVHTVASAIWSSKPGIMRPFILAVGEDVDVTNPDDVFWCLTTRLHPKRGVHVLDHAPAVALWPFLNKEERENGYGSRLLLDATFPYELPPAEVPNVMDFEHGWPEEVRKKVIDRWSEYGLE